MSTPTIHQRVDAVPSAMLGPWDAAVTVTPWQIPLPDLHWAENTGLLRALA